MEENNLNIASLDILSRSHKKGLIVGVIRFGSSLYSSNPGDIDLAIITTKGKLDEFVNLLVDDKSLTGYDISLIKEEEINSSKKFYFGGHGQHLVESIRNGITLIGDNPFKNYPSIDIQDIKLSVFERMKEYIYILRKSYFDENAEKKFHQRYNKMLKLSLFLLGENYAFPEILSVDIKDIQNSLIKIGYMPMEDKKKYIEYMWAKIDELYA